MLNLQRNPQLTALVETGDTYDELKGVELVGEGRISDDPEVVMECARSVVDRYFGVERAEDLDAVAEGLARKRVAIIIETDKVVSWDHTKLAGGY